MSVEESIAYTFWFVMLLWQSGRSIYVQYMNFAGVRDSGVRLQTPIWVCILFSATSVFCFHIELNSQEVPEQNLVPGMELTIGDSLILAVYSNEICFG